MLQVNAVKNDYQTLTSQLVIVQKEMVIQILSVSQMWVFQLVMIHGNSNVHPRPQVDTCTSKRI